jgi:hypothetical protein
MRTSKPRNTSPARNGWQDQRESRAAQISAKAHVGIDKLEKYGFDLPGDIGGGMPGRNVQRNPGTTRGSPRRSRTAKTSRISRIVGEIVMCLRVGRMGPISEEGPGQNNPDRSEGPWGGVQPHSKVAHYRVVGPTQSGNTDSDHEVREGRRQTVCPPTHAGSRLKRSMHWEGPV